MTVVCAVLFGRPFSEREYFGAAAFACLFFGLSAFFLGLLFLPVPSSALLGFAFAGVCGAFSLFLPRWAAAREDELLETQASVLLRLLSVQLCFQPFEAALVEAVYSGLGIPERRLAFLAEEVRSGKPVLKALQRLSSSTKSLLVRKACMQLSFCYSQGGYGSLEALASEFSLRQSSLQRSFASKASFLSVCFVVVSSLLPMFFASYVLVGSSFMQFTFGGPFVFAALAFGLPLVCAAVVAYAFFSLPGGSRA